MTHRETETIERLPAWVVPVLIACGIAVAGMAAVLASLLLRDEPAAAAPAVVAQQPATVTPIATMVPASQPTPEPPPLAITPSERDELFDKITNPPAVYVPEEFLAAATQPHDAPDVGRVLPINYPRILQGKQLYEARLLLLTRCADQYGSESGWAIAIRMKCVTNDQFRANAQVFINDQEVIALVPATATAMPYFGGWLLPKMKQGEYLTLIGRAPDDWIARAEGRPPPRDPSLTIRIDNVGD